MNASFHDYHREARVERGTLNGSITIVLLSNLKLIKILSPASVSAVTGRGRHTIKVAGKLV